MRELHKQQCPACSHIMRPKVKTRRAKLAGIVYLEVIYQCTKCRHKWAVDAPVTKRSRISEN